MLRMKVQTMRTLLWVGNLAVILAIGALLVKIFLGTRQKGPANLFAYLDKEKIEAAAEVPPVEVGDGGRGAQHWPLYDATHSLNVTGKEPPAPEVVDTTEAEAVPDLKPIVDVLRVDLMTISPEGSWAKIRYLEDGPLGVRPSQATPARTVLGGVRPREEPRLSPGFAFAGDDLRAPWDGAPFHGAVKAITFDGVVFEWGGEEVLLRPGELARPETPAKTMPGLDDPKMSEDELARRIAKAKVSRPIGEHGWYLGTDELDRLEEKHEELLAEVGVGMTYSRSEGRPLLQLNKIPSDSPVAERGFEEGDIVLSINDEPISSKYAAIQYFRQNPKTTKFNVEIERRGSRITKVFETAR